MPTSQKRIDANRLNCLKSRGATTAAGRARSKMNATKHAMTAQTDVVLGEDPQAFAELVDGWVADLDPRTRVEEALARHAGRACWRLERAILVQTARTSAHIENAASRELSKVLSIGLRLFRDSRGPTELYGVVAYDHKGPRTSWSGIADDPDDPDRLVRLLEKTAAGVGWLQDQWSELRALLEPGKAWMAHHKFKAIRLVGRQPMSALDDRQVATILVASWAINPVRQNAYSELKSEMDDEEHEAFVDRVRSQWTDMLDAGDPAEARRILTAIVDGEIERLAEIAAALDERAEYAAARSTAVDSFDDSHAGELLRRYETTSSRMMLRALSEFSKLRKANKDAQGKAKDEWTDANWSRQHLTDEAHPSQGEPRDCEDGGSSPFPVDEAGRLSCAPLPILHAPAQDAPIDPVATFGSSSAVENGDMTHPAGPETSTSTGDDDHRGEADAGDDAFLRNETIAGEQLDSPGEAVQPHPAAESHEQAIGIAGQHNERPEPDPHPLSAEDGTTNTVQLNLGRTILHELRRRQVDEGAGARLAATARMRRRLRGPANKQRFRKSAPGESREDASIVASSLPPDFALLLDEVHDELEAELGKRC